MVRHKPYPLLPVLDPDREVPVTGTFTTGDPDDPDDPDGAGDPNGAADGEDRPLRGAAWQDLADWGEVMATRSEEEATWWLLGPFHGGVPGMVRRVRRILDVSQRGLAAILEVSQSMVARWETGRTSPRAHVLLHLLRLARLHVSVEDESGEAVEPMRDDGARQRGGARFPAHADLRVRGWWIPRRLRAWTSIEAIHWERWSREVGDPEIGWCRSPVVRRFERERFGTPVDHPSRQQLLAEMERIEAARRAARDELRRRSRARA
jgi:HTH-type transcriptional regulator/antitoxin HipB